MSPTKIFLCAIFCLQLYVTDGMWFWKDGDRKVREMNGNAVLLIKTTVSALIRNLEQLSNAETKLDLKLKDPIYSGRFPGHTILKVPENLLRALEATLKALHISINDMIASYGAKDYGKALELINYAFTVLRLPNFAAIADSTVDPQTSEQFAQMLDSQLVEIMESVETLNEEAYSEMRELHVITNNFVRMKSANHDYIVKAVIAAFESIAKLSHVFDVALPIDRPTPFQSTDSDKRIERQDLEAFREKLHFVVYSLDHTREAVHAVAELKKAIQHISQLLGENQTEHLHHNQGTERHVLMRCLNDLASAHISFVMQLYASGGMKILKSSGHLVRLMDGNTFVVLWSTVSTLLWTLLKALRQSSSIEKSIQLEVNRPNDNERLPNLLALQIDENLLVALEATVRDIQGFFRAGMGMEDREPKIPVATHGLINIALTILRLPSLAPITQELAEQAPQTLGQFLVLLNSQFSEILTNVASLNRAAYHAMRRPHVISANYVGIEPATYASIAGKVVDAFESIGKLSNVSGTITLPIDRPNPDEIIDSNKRIERRDLKVFRELIFDVANTLKNMQKAPDVISKLKNVIGDITVILGESLERPLHALAKNDLRECSDDLALAHMTFVNGIYVTDGMKSWEKEERHVIEMDGNSFVLLWAIYSTVIHRVNNLRESSSAMRLGSPRETAWFPMGQTLEINANDLRELDATLREFKELLKQYYGEVDTKAKNIRALIDSALTILRLPNLAITYEETAAQGLYNLEDSSRLLDFQFQGIKESAELLNDDTYNEFIESREYAGSPVRILMNNYESITKGLLAAIEFIGAELKIGDISLPSVRPTISERNKTNMLIGAVQVVALLDRLDIVLVNLEPMENMVTVASDLRANVFGKLSQVSTRPYTIHEDDPPKYDLQQCFDNLTSIHVAFIIQVWPEPDLEYWAIGHANKV